MTAANRLVPLSDALRDHSTEGIAILTAEPWRVLHAVIYTMIALVVAAVAWSFIGRADVIVTAQGTLVPAAEVRRFLCKNINFLNFSPLFIVRFD